MELQYYTLQTIYNIVKEDSQPHTYLCNTREIIVRQMFGWDDIKTHLELLAMEQLIIIRQLGSVAISITPAGLEKVRSIIRMTA